MKLVMYRRPSKRVQLIRRILTYVLMVLAIIVIAGVILLFLLGYRLDGRNGLEQGALLQFNTQPTGASVTVDGAKLGSTTPNKSTVMAGTHTIVMTKDGYQPWTNTVNTAAGTLTWLDYVLLIPTHLSPETVATYPSLTGMLPSPNNQTIIMQQKADQPTFDLDDLRSVQPKLSTITLPASDYTAPTDPTAPNVFSLDSWDNNGRYVIVKHAYDNKVEWLLLDTQNVANSTDITSSLGVDVSKIQFAGTSGTVMYALSTDGTIRKIDLNAKTISAPLVSNVTDFNLFQTSVITYVGTDGKGQYVAGLYQDGDTQSDVLRTVPNNDGFHIATTQYYDNYVALSTGKDVTILKGSYPHSSADSTSLQPFAQFTFPTTVQSLGFSPDGEYVIAQAGRQYETYDLEHAQTYTATVKATTPGAPLRWLTKAILYTDADSTLSIRDFDNTNIHTINAVAPGFAATLSPNDRYLYSVSKDSQGQFILQRVTLLLN